MTSALLLALLAGPAGAAPPPKPAPPAKPGTAAPAAPAGMAASTAPAQPTVQDIYGGDAYRDPFMKLGAAGAQAVAAPVAEFKVEDFSIHTLELKGIMRDRGGPIAVLVDTSTHASFTLRGGRLYGPKKKTIPGVTGTVRPDRKTVTLMTADKDVQTLRLGENADRAEE